MHHLTNFQEEDLELFEHSLQYDPSGTLYIETFAVDRDGSNRRPGYSLWDTHYKDQSQYWRAFDAMREQKESGMDLWMVLPENKFPLPKR